MPWRDATGSCAGFAENRVAFATSVGREGVAGSRSLLVRHPSGPFGGFVLGSVL